MLFVYNLARASDDLCQCISFINLALKAFSLLAIFTLRPFDLPKKARLNQDGPAASSSTMNHFLICVWVFCALSSISVNVRPTSGF